MAIRSLWRLLACVSVATLVSLLLTPAGALAEGWPGIGDRVAYAESLPHYNLGNRYLARKWYEKAVEKYDDAIKIYPYDADVYINLGIAFRRLNNVSGAEYAYKKAIELNKKDWMSWSNLANLYMLSDRFKESLECFKSALACNPPAKEKESIDSNIVGIKKIMKAKGLLNPKTAQFGSGNSRLARKPIAGKQSRKVLRRKSAAKVSTASSGTSAVAESAYEAWLGQ